MNVRLWGLILQYVVMLRVMIIGMWSDLRACFVCQVHLLYRCAGMVVMSGDVGCCC